MTGFDMLDLDQETEVLSGFDVQIYVEEYKIFIDQSTEKLNDTLQKSTCLDKNVARSFLSIIDEGYDKINQLSEMMEYELVEDPEGITSKMDTMNSCLYQLMDQKFRSSLCSEQGFRMMNQKNYMQWVDIYYNFFCVSQDRSYLFTALEFSDLELLWISDLFMEKNGKNNKKPRYFTYLEILSKKYKNLKILGVDQILEISNLNNICSRQVNLGETFRNFFKFKISD
jgi:hypothetical protein